MEVLLGPSPVVYGADAFMGVVNIITHDENDEDINEVGIHYGSDDYRYGYGWLNQTNKNKININL